MASSQHGSVERGAGSAQGGTPGSPPRPMQGRVGDGPAGAGACFVGGFVSVAAPTSHHSFRYSGPRPPPSGQMQLESGSGEEDEEEEGEGEEDEDHEGSGDDSEARWDPEMHGGGKGGDDEEDHEIDGLEPEEVEEGVGEGGEGAATEAASHHVAEGGGSMGVKVGRKQASIRMPKRRKRASKLRERAYPCTFIGKPLGEGVVAPDYHTAHMHVWHHRYHTPSVHLPGETFPRGGYKGVPDGYVDGWPHAKSWPHLAKKKETASGGAPGSGGMERFMTTKLSTEELRQAIAKLVVTCDLPFHIVESEAKNFIPSRWTVSRDIVVYATAALQSAIAEMLAKEGELGCKVSITIDMWTAPNNKAWLVVTSHWIDENFQLRTMVLEFHEMLGRHGGREMAQVVEETIVHAGSTGCGFHTEVAEDTERDGVVDWLLSTALGVFLGPTADLELAGQPRHAEASVEAGAGQSYALGVDPRHGRACGCSAEPHHCLLRPDTVSVIPPSPQTILSTRQGLSKTDKKKVESLRLTDADWETLQAVKTFLSPFAKVSKAAEGAAYPTVSMVVPYYNGLIDAMESRLAKGPSPTLQPMIVAALSHLKKYAYITSNEHWIATFLDPSMKATWFDDAHWEKLHPETDRRVRPRPASGEVIKLVRDRVAEYQARAAELAPRPTPLAPVAEEEEGDEEEDDDDAQFLPSRRRLAARLSASQDAGAGGMVQDDEVSRYLSERVRCDVTALEYWRSATNMQMLRRMARDYLAIPATFASSERVFSLGRNLISWKRHRLASQRTRAVMILRSWYSSHPGQRIGEGRRPRGVAPPEFAIEGEGAEEDDEEEEEGVEADDTAGGEDAVVGSSSAVAP
ncbi:unnamed protein product [Closterium sp. NIES-53]